MTTYKALTQASQLAHYQLTFFREAINSQALKEQFDISIKEMDKILKQQEKEMAEEKVTQTIDDKITELFNILTKQQAEVEAAELATKKPWKTNCSFMLNMVTTNINIQT